MRVKKLHLERLKKLNQKKVTLSSVDRQRELEWLGKLKVVYGEMKQIEENFTEDTSIVSSFLEKMSEAEKIGGKLDEYQQKKQKKYDSIIKEIMSIKKIILDSNPNTSESDFNKWFKENIPGENYRVK